MQFLPIVGLDRRNEARIKETFTWLIPLGEKIVKEKIVDKKRIVPPITKERNLRRRNN